MASGYQVAADVGSNAGRPSQMLLPEVSVCSRSRSAVRLVRVYSTPGMGAARRSLTANAIDEERLVEQPRAMLDR